MGMASKHMFWRLTFLLAVSLSHVTAEDDGKGQDRKIALLITDVQRCFTRGGTLAITDADAIVDVINNMRKEHGNKFNMVVHSQDWHCHNHVSFASMYPNHGVYDNIELDYNGAGNLCKGPEVTAEYVHACTTSDIRHKLNQTLWPDHCIKHTTDADFHPRLDKRSTDTVVQKGFHCQIDSYSMFYDNGEFSQTDLSLLLGEAGINTLFLTGLALDYCVHWTAREAKIKFKYDTYVVVDATRPVAVKTGELAKDDMLKTGIKLINSDELGDVIKMLGPYNSGWRVSQVNLLLLAAALLLTFSRQ